MASAAGTTEGILLLSQRIDRLAERVELLHERLSEALPQPPPAREAVRPTAAPQAAGSPKAGGGGCRRAEKPAGTKQQSFNPLGTLRPPPIPNGFGPVHGQSTFPSVIPELGGSHSIVAGPVVTGTVPDLCLASLLGLFELERRVGLLTVHADEHTLELELRHGVVGRCYFDGAPAPALQSIRQAFRWRTGQFAFRRTDGANDIEPPLSVSALLLEAVRQNDEAACVS